MCLSVYATSISTQKEPLQVIKDEAKQAPPRAGRAQDGQSSLSQSLGNLRCCDCFFLSKNVLPFFVTLHFLFFLTFPSPFPGAHFSPFPAIFTQMPEHILPTKPSMGSAQATRIRPPANLSQRRGSSQTRPARLSNPSACLRAQVDGIFSIRREASVVVS